MVTAADTGVSSNKSLGMSSPFPDNLKVYVNLLVKKKKKKEDQHETPKLVRGTKIKLSA